MKKVINSEKIATLLYLRAIANHQARQHGEPDADTVKEILELTSSLSEVELSVLFEMKSVKLLETF